jgi:hypothetical protein
MGQHIYVIRTFVRIGSGLGALPPTICFERDLAIEMAQADEQAAEGVAVYELSNSATSENAAQPFAAFGTVPEDYWHIGRAELLAAAPARVKA